jgi:hypothetical protein
MEDFFLFLRLGFEHISDVKGYDHILFIASICAIYPMSAWRTLLVMITAFTVGHSLTLALSTLRVIEVSASIVEFLIPVTIAASCVINLIEPPNRLESRSATLVAKYFGALFFGLIHGLGFSNFLRDMLGVESNLLKPLLAFNLGVEAGQVCIAGGSLILSFLMVERFGVARREWNIGLSCCILGVAFTMILERSVF